jgi:hypothetical protein
MTRRHLVLLGGTLVSDGGELVAPGGSEGLLAVTGGGVNCRGGLGSCCGAGWSVGQPVSAGDADQA